ELARTLDDDFADPDGGWYATARDASTILARTRPTDDGPTPSGTAVAAIDLLRLAELGDDDELRARAERAISAAPRSASLWSALPLARAEPLEIAIVTSDPRDAAPLVDVIRRTYLPEAALALPGTDVPFVAGKVARNGRATAYVCHRTRCDNPTTD